MCTPKCQTQIVFWQLWCVVNLWWQPWRVHAERAHARTYPREVQKYAKTLQKKVSQCEFFHL